MRRWHDAHLVDHTAPPGGAAGERADRVGDRSAARRLRPRSRRRQLATATAGLLRALGSTPQEVARSLESSGARGVPQDPRACAVASYLTAVVGADPGVRSLHVNRLTVDLRPEAWWQRRVTVALPPQVRRFVAAFDAMAYPRLLSPPARPRSDHHHP